MVKDRCDIMKTRIQIEFPMIQKMLESNISPW